MSAQGEINKMTYDLGKIDAAWTGFVICGGLMYTPNGYFYPPGFIYSIPIRIQPISHYGRELAVPRQLLL
jgi:hypothetical protein